MYLPLVGTPDSYNRLCGAVVSALWESGLHITEMNPFSGRIEGCTRFGLEDREGSIWLHIQKTAPTHRHRVVVQIEPEHRGGFWVRVTAHKDAKGRSGETWSPKGRDGVFERQLIDRISKALWREEEDSAAFVLPSVDSPFFALKERWARWGLASLTTWQLPPEECVYRDGRGSGLPTATFYISTFK
jgi:hypothetical protein